MRGDVLCAWKEVQFVPTDYVIFLLEANLLGAIII